MRHLGMFLAWNSCNLGLMSNTCERISVLDHGQKIADGTPEEVKNNHSVIEAYLGKEMADEEIRRVITG